MAKEAETANVDPAAAATGDPSAAGDASPAAPKRSKLKVFAIGGVALTLCLGGGGYFAMPMVLTMLGSSAETAAAHEAEADAETAAEAEPEAAPEHEAGEASADGEGGGHGGGAAVPPQKALPVQKLALAEREAEDYQIVSIYDGEAYLATKDTVIRVRIGSTAPGLGDILAIEPSDSGGTVKGSLATLKTS